MRRKVTEYKAIAIRVDSGRWTIGLASPFFHLPLVREGDYEMSHTQARSSAKAINGWGAASGEFRRAFKG